MNHDPGLRKVLISKNWQSAGVRTSIFQDSSRDEKGARHLLAGYFDSGAAMMKIGLKCLRNGFNFPDSLLLL